MLKEDIALSQTRHQLKYDLIQLYCLSEQISMLVRSSSCQDLLWKCQFPVD